MEPREFEGQTRVLNAPAGWNSSQPLKCGMLPVRDASPDGVPCMQSIWKPDAAELAELVRGGHVVLTVYGRGHPPVWLGVATTELVADVDRKPPDA